MKIKESILNKLGFLYQRHQNNKIIYSVDPKIFKNLNICQKEFIEKLKSKFSFLF